jgi:hypothetical protein
LWRGFRTRAFERFLRVTADDVRPRSIGEILDRAITTYVRRCVPLFVVLALVAIPIAVLQVVAQPGLTHLMELFNRVLTLPPGDVADRAQTLLAINQALAPRGWVVLLSLAQVALLPLARTALIVFAARALDGKPVSIAAAYRIGLRRWLPQLAVLFAWWFVFGCAFGVTFVLVVVVAVLAVAALSVLSRTAAVVVGIAFGLLIAAVSLVVLALGYLAWLMASVSVATEDGNPLHAIGRAVRRTLDRSRWRRALAVAAAVLALEWFGALAFVAFGALAAYLTHTVLTYALIVSVGSIVLEGLILVFALIYVRDVRLRSEGTDLLSELAMPERA